VSKLSKDTILEKGEEPSKFMAVGISGIGVNYLVVIITRDLFGIDERIALAIAIFISMTTNYILNRIWTFQSNNPILLEYLKYLASNALGAIIQWIVTFVVVELFTIDNLVLIEDLVEIPFFYVAMTIGIGFGFISNYFFSKYLVFLPQLSGN
jgi:dolichol-phosphate mannosyltransferase